MTYRAKNIHHLQRDPATEARLQARAEAAALETRLRRQMALASAVSLIGSILFPWHKKPVAQHAVQRRQA